MTMTQSRICKSALFACLSILLVAVFHQTARAQEFRGSIQGTVTDSKGAVVPKATVELVNVFTGVKRTGTTNETGHYLFDLVDPSTYTVLVNAAGFATSTYEKILVQSRAAVTADAVLQVAGAQNTVVVEANVNTVDFTSSNVQMTLDQRLVEETPNLGRNPFLLALLDPAVVDTRPTNELPYDTWGSNSLQIAGSQNFSNDLQTDGAPVGLGLKNVWVPNQDAVKEVLIQSNAVDSEFGHSGGGIISTTLKSGTNGYHGDAFWTGRYPWMNALQDSYTANNTVPVPAISRQNMYGFTFGNPILKNKLFNLFSWENWRRTDPSILQASVPTTAEMQGDFSGFPLPIYDPYTTQTDAAGKVIRTAFPNNVIPSNRINPLAAKFMGSLNWKPNSGAGDGPGNGPGTFNWSGASPVQTNYTNYMDKVDYHFRDNLTFSGHAGKYSSPQVPLNGTGSNLYQPLATDTEGTQISASMTYIMNASTVFVVGGSWSSLVDEVAPYHSVPGLDWSDLFSSQPFLQNIAIPGQGLPKTPPRIEIHDANGSDDMLVGGPGGYWYSHPEGHAIWGDVIKTFQKHTLKAGMDQRYEYSRSALFVGSGFAFYPNSTASTYVSPDTSKSGSPYASFLLGVLGDSADPNWAWGGGSTMHQTIITTPKSNYWSYYVNDDWKATRNLTITAGLRYEYEEPWTDPQNRGSRYLDLGSTNTDLAASNPQIDGATQQLVSQLYAGPTQKLTNGQWIFSTPSHPGMWEALNNVFLPRLGFAYRLNDKTAINAAWARWSQPWVQQNYGNTGSFLDVVYPGFTTDQNPEYMIQGVPQVNLSDPFPASAPLVPAVGKGYGADLGLGQGNEYFAQNRKRTTSDRFNVGVQRQLPFNFVGKATYLAALTHDIGWGYNPNMVNPALSLDPTTGPQLNQSVPNPFYNIGTSITFPGSMRYQQTVPLSQLLRPYPQYGDLQQDWTPGLGANYQSIGIEVQRTYHNGLSLLANYNYHYEKDQYFFDNLDQYNLTWRTKPSNNSRQGLTEASSWEIPVGKGRHYLYSTPTLVDTLIGGWEISHVLTYKSGDYPQLNNYMQVSNPTQHVPKGRYWNPDAFVSVPAYTRSNSQWVYTNIKGPHWINVDATINKNIKFGDRVTGKLYATGYNALNHYIPADPNTGNGSSFGESTNQGNTGRQVDLGVKLTF